MRMCTTGKSQARSYNISLLKEIKLPDIDPELANQSDPLDVYGCLASKEITRGVIEWMCLLVRANRWGDGKDFGREPPFVHDGEAVFGRGKAVTKRFGEDLTERIKSEGGMSMDVLMMELGLSNEEKRFGNERIPECQLRDTALAFLLELPRMALMGFRKRQEKMFKKEGSSTFRNLVRLLDDLSFWSVSEDLFKNLVRVMDTRGLWRYFGRGELFIQNSIVTFVWALKIRIGEQYERKLVDTMGLYSFLLIGLESGSLATHNVVTDACKLLEVEKYSEYLCDLELGDEVEGFMGLLKVRSADLRDRDNPWYRYSRSLLCNVKSEFSFTQFKRLAFVSLLICANNKTEEIKKICRIPPFNTFNMRRIKRYQNIVSALNEKRRKRFWKRVLDSVPSPSRRSFILERLGSGFEDIP
ncbi:unnamed protein product [Calicophoron daubneyi]|uniref:Uncharacterized protein n=1 Tax=Calicophoron daubneyi TaxID=300641 RepID=A0AAV2TQQ7_CALDB